MDYSVSSEFIFDCFRLILIVFIACLMNRGFLRDLAQCLKDLSCWIYSDWLLWSVRHDRYAQAGLTMIDSVMAGDPSWGYVKHNAYLWAIDFIAHAEDIAKGKF